MRCDIGSIWLVVRDFLFQSTHLREVRQGVRIVDSRRKGISIHAPTWGATLNIPSFRFVIWFQSTHLREVRLLSSAVLGLLLLFQSTHLREVRRATYPFYCWRPQHFNPRTYVRCDATSDFLRQAARISIHAPTWGATTSQGTTKGEYAISIHAPTWGAT